MDSNDTTDATERAVLSPKALTERLVDASVGDRLLFNDNDVAMEVVDTGSYSVTLVDSEDNEYTISQNLQTGEWNVHQSLWWVQVGDDE